MMIPPKPKTPAVQSVAGAPPRARILLAEDNPCNQKLVVRLLERSGFCVDVANNGRDALTAFHERSYDLILMDCQMPTMDGLAAATEIRRCESSVKHTPIIALTANSRPQDRTLCQDAGMDDYLAKPFKWDALFDVVERWLPKKPLPPDTLSVHASVDETSVDAAPHLDHDLLAQLQQLNGDDDPTFCQTLVVNFLSDTAQHVSEMRKVLATGHIHELARTAHSLKGTCGNFGAKRLEALSKTLQAAAQDGDCSLADALLIQMEAGLTDLKQSLMAALKASEQSTTRPSRTRPWPQNILIVEDERNMLMIIKRIVMRLGCKRVQDARDGARALAMLRQESVDLVITDWSMPSMDGLQLLRHMQQDSLLRQIPVLFLSGEADGHRVREAIGAGASAYVLKPFTPTLLENKLKEMFAYSDT